MEILALFLEDDNANVGTLKIIAPRAKVPIYRIAAAANITGNERVEI